MDLHRVPAAQGGRRAGRFFQVGELAAGASGALRIPRGAFDLPDASIPYVDRGEARAHQVRVAGENLQRIRHLERRHRGHNRVQHSGGLARRLHARRRIGIDAAQARRAARDHRHGQAVTAHGRSVDPRNAAAHGEIVDQVARFKVIGAVQNEVRAAQQIRHVGGREVRHHAARVNAGINARDMPLGGGGFGKGLGGGGFLEQPLAMQVARLHVIAIDDGEGADPRPGQRRDVKTSQRAAAYHGRVRPQQGLLSPFPDAWKQNLPRVALALGRVH